jgi:hypothetical protein
MKSNSRNWIKIILIVFVAINIIGDIGNIGLWYANSDSQESLRGSYIASVTGAENALIVGTVILAIVALAYAATLFGLFKKQTWAPLLIIVISVVNRVIGVFLYEFNEAFYIWLVWTIILVALAYLDFRKLQRSHQEDGAGVEQ